jgi:hypothetical protein
MSHPCPESSILRIVFIYPLYLIIFNYKKIDFKLYCDKIL